MMLLGIDIGTTHIKAGLYTDNGVCLSIVSRQNITHRGKGGSFYYDPDELYQTVCSAVSELAIGVQPNLIRTIGIASMAETGLLVDKKTGFQRCPFIPWFDTKASSEIKSIATSVQPFEQFKKTGIRPSFKCALTKLLWLKAQDASILDDAIWMGVADYVAYRMTGCIKTDYSLAVRTYAFRIDQKVWDTEILEGHGLNVTMFPPALSSGNVVGSLQKRSAQEMELLPGIPVSISGHDHVCAAFGVRKVIDDISSEFIVDSMGTAEALIGSIKDRDLGEQEFKSGFAFGCDVTPGRLYWMGGLSASGGSIEWIRRLIGNPSLTYDEMENWLEEVGEEPTGIMYFPYLSGSGSPHSDVNVRAAFIGLGNSHSQSDLIKSVMEGTAYEIEFIRRRAKSTLGVKVDKIVVVGGGTHNPHWLQIKADIFGCPLRIPEINNATLFGAALLAGIGSGIYHDEADVSRKIVSTEGYTVIPDTNKHKVYSELYENKFIAFQESLRQISRI
jgi:sugar (pentulose or hexulose) kinase